MSTPQPAFQHPFRRLVSELYEAMKDAGVDFLSEYDEEDRAYWEPQAVGKVLKVAHELRAVANALDITQGNSDANGYPQWGQDMALRVALGELAEMVRRHEEDES